MKRIVFAISLLTLWQCVITGIVLVERQQAAERFVMVSKVVMGIYFRGQKGKTDETSGFPSLGFLESERAQ